MLLYIRRLDSTVGSRMGKPAPRPWLRHGSCARVVGLPRLLPSRLCPQLVFFGMRYSLRSSRPFWAKLD